MRAQTGQPRNAWVAAAILLLFSLLGVHNIFHYSPTYDEPKFLSAGQELVSGEGWQTEASVVHGPLSFYTHGLLLRPFSFDSEVQKLRWARVTMLFYGLALGTLVYVWSVQLFGAAGGIVSLMLYSFNSNILGHSSLITTDIIHACFSLFLLYFFWRYITEGKKRWSAAAGISLGLAMLSKYTATIWIILLPAIAAACLLLRHLPMNDRTDSGYSRRTLTELLLGLVTIFLIAVLVLNVGYGFSGSFRPLGADRYQSSLLAALSRTPLLSRIPVPLPYPFMRGFDEQKYISEVGHPSFLAGMHSTQGWWYYYAACFFLKMPAAFWPLMIWAGINIVRDRERYRRSAGFVLIFSASAIVAASSLLSKSHAGFRYVIATVPMLFVLAGAVAMHATRWPKRVAAAGLVVLYAGPALLIHPHHLAYFTEFVGGPKNGYKWLSDSNLDWGQDLEHARRYVRESGVPVTVNPGIMPVPGRIVVNATTLQDCFTMNDVHGWLWSFAPEDYIGYSWLVFDVSEEMVRRRVSPGSSRLPEIYYIGALAYASDELGDAERFAITALAANPGLPEALYLRGLAQMGQGRLDEAADAFASVPVTHPFYVDARSHLSFLAAAQGDWEAGGVFRRQAMVEETLRAYAKRPILDVGRYEDLVAVSPSDWRLHNNLGVSLWARGKLSESEREIHLALELQPNYVEALANLAIVLEEGNRFDEALRALEQYYSDFLLLRTLPYRDYRVYYEDTRVMFGDTLEIYPKADKEVLWLKRHLARQPADVAALNKLAIVLMKRGRFDESLETLQDALTIAPRSSALYTNLAVLYTEKKMFQQALGACEQSLDIDPANSSARELLLSVRRRLSLSQSRAQSP